MPIRLTLAILDAMLQALDRAPRSEFPEDDLRRAQARSWVVQEITHRNKVNKRQQFGLDSSDHADVLDRARRLRQGEPLD